MSTVSLISKQSKFNLNIDGYNIEIESYNFPDRHVIHMYFQTGTDLIINKELTSKETKNVSHICVVKQKGIL